MILFEVIDFDGRRDESPWIFVKWLNEIEQFFDRRNFSYSTRVRFAKRKLIGRAKIFGRILNICALLGKNRLLLNGKT